MTLWETMYFQDFYTQTINHWKNLIVHKSNKTEKKLNFKISINILLQVNIYSDIR